MATTRKKASSGAILAAIVGLVILAVLLAPAESDVGGNYSTQSAGPSGARLAYDLSRRLGWSSERRDVPFTRDTTNAPVQALVGVSLGAQESHALLDFVRHGGAVLVAGTDGDLTDSLHLTAGRQGLSTLGDAPECPARDPFDNAIQGSRPIAPVRWSQPSPPDTVGFGTLQSRTRQIRAAVGFPLGSGRIVVIGDADFLANDVMRVCATESDVAFVRMLEYLTNGRRTRIAFDEFHHGSGIHGGSFSAMWMYTEGTPSGRMLAQIVLGGLLLLFAAAPRPLSPRDSVRVGRRSPLEHADALAHAYAAVGATRTATARLLAGVRRRVRRGRAGSRESDEEILAAALTTAPAAAPAVAVVSRALADPVPVNELAGVAAALSTIEAALTSRPTIPKP